MTTRTILIVCLAASCGEDGTIPVDGDASTLLPCTDKNFTNNLVLPKAFSLIDFLPYQQGSIALVSHEDFGLQLVTSDLERIPLTAQEPKHSVLSQGPGDSFCVTWTPENVGPLHRACSPDFEVQELRGKIRVSDDLHVADSDTMGTIAFFQSGASADAAILKDRVWQDKELFESSISTFGGAISYQGIPYACLLTSSDGLGIVSEERIFTELDRVFTTPATSVSACSLHIQGDIPLDLAFIAFVRTTNNNAPSIRPEQNGARVYN